MEEANIILFAASEPDSRYGCHLNRRIGKTEYLPIGLWWYAGEVR
jgi:hypothetical protein